MPQPLARGVELFLLHDAFGPLLARLVDRLTAGDPITPEEAAFYGGFAGSTEKKTLDPLYQEYGEAALR